MSVAVHREALRASLAGYLRTGITGGTDATVTSQIVGELRRASQSLISEVVSEWQYANAAIYRIPDEVLALCFTLMPFADRIAASHVSRRWRYISLAYPAVWSRIEMEDRFDHKPALFKMALDRTGSHPVDILGCPAFDYDGLVEESLAAHIHHIRSLVYTSIPRPGFLDLHAPMLEHLRGGENAADLHITPEFLGGEVSRLRSLQAPVIVFPATCPALSTIADLGIHAPTTTQDAAHFGQLFHLCPALESLVLRGITSAIAPFLPTGPVPASLDRIVLASDEEDFDLSEYFAPWRLDGVRDIAVYQNAVVRENLPHFFTGAVSVTVRRERGTGSTGVISMGPGGRHHEIEYWDPDDELGGPAEKMIEFQSTLAALTTMSIPATCLPGYLAVLAVLPALLRLEVKIEELDGPPGVHVFQWDVLEHMARLAQMRPGLQAMVLSVACSKPQCPTTRQDADNIIARLQGCTRLPPILVTGFSAHALQGLEVLDFEGFWVAFVPDK